ncbi:MAG: peptide chain release factor-like protein [Simkaniaceae bacterium]|nr:MAG: peptide chain release factor-like protein [Simkaniaceae bacterium]
MPVSPEKKRALARRIEELGITDNDLTEKFILGSGKGGQKVNKTASCVYLKHLPTGIEVKCQQERSRELNRYLARRELCEKIAYEIHQEKTKKRKEMEKIRQQKKRRSRRLKQKILEDKKKHSEVKKMRKKIEE